MAGRIWLTDGKGHVGQEVLVRRLAAAPYVILGETHDNPDHHRIQAWVAARLTGEDRNRALVFEMFREGQQSKIDLHLKAHPDDWQGLGAAAGWSGSGWPPWSEYAPIAAPTVARRLPVIAANLDRALVRAVIKEGYTALLPAKLESLGMNRPLPASILETMDLEIAEAHCGYIDAGKARPFTRVQVVRDAQFALSMRNGASRSDGALLIAGNGHARRDRGVPYHLMRQGIRPGEIFSLGIIEVEEGRNSPEDYGSSYGTRRPPFDAVWFTPRAAREDPCKAFDSIKKKR